MCASCAIRACCASWRTRAAEIQQNALEAHGEASGIAELAEQRIYGIRQGREIKGLSKLSEVIADLYTELDERAKSDSDIPGMSTGFHALDTALDRPEQVRPDPDRGASRAWARPRSRSTSRSTRPRPASRASPRATKRARACACSSSRWARSSWPAAFLSSEALIESQKLKTGNLDGEDWVKIARASGVLAGLDIYVDDNPAITVAEIKAKCRRLGDELGLIVIDYCS